MGCNVKTSEHALFHDVNSSLYDYLMNQCSGSTSDAQRSPCDPPTADEACAKTGFSKANAIDACSPLRSSTTPQAYESCLYDCCITADASFCRGLAEETDSQTKEFEQELLHDGRFVNIDAMKAFYDLNATLPPASDSRSVCSIAFGASNESVNTTVLPNGMGLPGSVGGDVQRQQRP